MVDTRIFVFYKAKENFLHRRHLASIKFSASGNLTVGSLLECLYKTEVVVIFARNLSQSEAYDQEESISHLASPSHLPPG